MIRSMDKDDSVPIAVYVLLAVLLGPFAFFMVMPSLLMVILHNPILSGIASGTIASAFILGVVRHVNRRDAPRRISPPDDTADEHSAKSI